MKTTHEDTMRRDFEAIPTREKNAIQRIISIIDEASRERDRYEYGVPLDEEWREGLYLTIRAEWQAALQPRKGGEEDTAYMKEAITEQLNEGAGNWYSCSGCHEGGEYGGNAHNYPYSEIFKCNPGSGCGECGGIGVRWDDTDYDHMAREILAEEIAQAPVGVTDTRIIEHGLGTIMIDTGTYGGDPAIFISPAPEKGEVGASAEHIKRDLKSLVEGETVLVFRDGKGIDALQYHIDKLKPHLLSVEPVSDSEIAIFTARYFAGYNYSHHEQEQCNGFASALLTHYRIVRA